MTELDLYRDAVISIMLWWHKKNLTTYGVRIPGTNEYAVVVRKKGFQVGDYLGIEIYDQYYEKCQIVKVYD